MKAEYTETTEEKISLGQTVYVKACCECVNTKTDWETGTVECPFEDDCDFDVCDNGNEKYFKTRIVEKTEKLNLRGTANVIYTAENIFAEIRESDFGLSVLTEEQYKELIEAKGQK